MRKFVIGTDDPESADVRALLDRHLAFARQRGCRRVSLETGSTAPFAHARALYASAGFEICEPFAAYGPSPNSVCMTLPLRAS